MVLCKLLQALLVEISGPGWRSHDGSLSVSVVHYHLISEVGPENNLLPLIDMQSYHCVLIWIGAELGAPVLRSE